MASPQEHYSDINGANLCWFEWGEPTSEPTIVLIHATGFHARCWDQVVKYLPGRHVVALDMRGHGRSSKHGPMPWSAYAADAAEFIASLPYEPLTLVGHSMGGYCVTSALPRVAAKVRDVILVDPVIMSPELYGAPSHHLEFMEGASEHPVARRRNHFDDAQAMFDNFHGRASYASWLDESLHDYCDYGLLPDEEQGGFQLACPPVIEASVYMGSQESPIADLGEGIDMPVTVLRAQQREEGSTTLDFTKSPTWSELAGVFKQGRDLYLPELTHFMPMQAPELVAEYITGKR